MRRKLAHDEKAPTGLVGIVGQGLRAGHQSLGLRGSAGRAGEVGGLAMMAEVSNASTMRQRPARGSAEWAARQIPGELVAFALGAHGGILDTDSFLSALSVDPSFAN
jgi:hypothetical protein